MLPGNRIRLLGFSRLYRAICLLLLHDIWLQRQWRLCSGSLDAGMYQEGITLILRVKDRVTRIIAGYVIAERRCGVYRQNLSKTVPKTVSSSSSECCDSRRQVAVKLLGTSCNGLKTLLITSATLRVGHLHCPISAATRTPINTRMHSTKVILASTL